MSHRLSGDTDIETPGEDYENVWYSAISLAVGYIRELTYYLEYAPSLSLSNGTPTLYLLIVVVSQL